MRKNRLWLKTVLKIGEVLPEATVNQTQNAVVFWTRCRLISGPSFLLLLPWGASAVLVLVERSRYQHLSFHEEKEMKPAKHRCFLFSV